MFYPGIEPQSRNHGTKLGMSDLSIPIEYTRITPDG